MGGATSVSRWRQRRANAFSECFAGLWGVDRGDSVAGAPVDERPIGEPVEESRATQPGALTIIAPTVMTAGGSAFAGGVWGYFGLADHLYQPIRGLGNRG